MAIFIQTFYNFLFLIYFSLVTQVSLFAYPTMIYEESSERLFRRYHRDVVKPSNCQKMVYVKNRGFVKLAFIFNSSTTGHT